MIHSIKAPTPKKLTHKSGSLRAYLPALRDFGVQYTEEEISEHVLDEGDLSSYELHLTVEAK